MVVAVVLAAGSSARMGKPKLALQVEADTLTIEGEIALDMPEGMEASHAEVSLPVVH